MQINLSEVQLSKSRPTVPEAVNALAESMRVNGLLNPIIVRRAQVFVGIVREGYKVVAGNHRVSAARALGWTHIDAFIHEGDELTAELAEIDENLQRAELTPAQRAAAIHRRKEIWETLNPENGANCPTSGGRGNKGFAGDTATKTGEDKRNINKAVKVAEALGPDIHEVVGTSLDKGVELDALKELPAEERRELIDRAKAGEQVSARSPRLSDDGRLGRLIGQVIGELARLPGAGSPDDVAHAMSTRPINPDLEPYIAAIHTAYKAKRRVA